ncbi:hypothetical protein HDK64DRAFT_262266 [Phyllosticta capitalensis]
MLPMILHLGLWLVLESSPSSYLSFNPHALPFFSPFPQTLSRSPHLHLLSQSLSVTLSRPSSLNSSQWPTNPVCHFSICAID